MANFRRSGMMAEARRLHPNVNIAECGNIIVFGDHFDPPAGVFLSCHGSINDQNTYASPVPLQYYCAHDSTLGFHLRTFNFGRPQILANPLPVNQRPNYAQVNGRPGNHLLLPANTMSPDYVLRKFQGADNSADGAAGHAETYASIAGVVARNPTLVIITVRDRMFGGPVRVSTVVPQIRAELRNVQLIHCLFCRETPQTQAGHNACPDGCQVCG